MDEAAADVEVPRCPEAGEKAEARMSDAARSESDARVLDDKMQCRMWFLPAVEFSLYFTLHLCQNPATWTPVPEVPVALLGALTLARALVGLPTWLRRRAPGSCRGPSLWPLIKSVHTGRTIVDLPSTLLVCQRPKVPLPWYLR